MKKIWALLLAAVMCLSLAACGAKDGSTEANTVAPVVVDGKETSVNDFLIEHLNEYIKSEDFIAREKAYKDLSYSEPREPELTMAIELNVKGIGPNQIDLHFLLVKLSCDYVVDDSGYDIANLVVDYETGKIYDQYSLDESWQGQESIEGYICRTMKSYFADPSYNYETIFSDDIETCTMLAQADIDTINASLKR